jgi:hypothetical protein
MFKTIIFSVIVVVSLSLVARRMSCLNLLVIYGWIIQRLNMEFENECPFALKWTQMLLSKETDCGFTITYPKMKATIYLTYKSHEKH